ncbi:MAG: hypothetical protein IKN15_10530 [Bacteroidaceae bacterium]|nr:hypothetical protein [Bacteroidaceae bacterium]
MKKTLLTLSMLLTCMLGTQAQTLTLSDNYDQVEKINKEAEKGGTRLVRFSSSRLINQDNWNVLVLPFDVSPIVISKAFGYAAVDVLDESNNVPNTMHFITISSGTIDAGTPFLVHPTSDEGAPTDFQNQVVFSDVVIKKVESQMVTTDNNGNRFIGVFSPTTFYGKDFWYMSKGMWKRASKFTEENPVSLKPFRAYIDMSNAKSKAAEAPMIIIDEPDGTTTVIDAATFNKGEFNSNADNGWYNVTGMRLVDEPTEKGVYIHNARKVIIK